LLDDFFPANLGDILSKRHLGIPLSQNELGFISAAKARRELLMNDTSDVESIRKPPLPFPYILAHDIVELLSEKYDWEDFLRSLRGHLNLAHEPLISLYIKRHGLSLPIPLDILHTNAHDCENTQGPHKQIEDELSVQAELAAQEALRSVYCQSQYQSLQEQNGGSYITGPYGAFD